MAAGSVPPNKHGTAGAGRVSAHPSRIGNSFKAVPAGPAACESSPRK